MRQDPANASESSPGLRRGGTPSPEPEVELFGGSDMRVLLSSWGSRGDVEPLMGLAVALRELGVEVASVRTTGLRGTCGEGRRAADPDGQVVARNAARRETADTCGCAADGGQPRRHAIRHGGRGGRRLRRGGGDRSDARRRAIDSGEAGHRLRVRRLPPRHHPVAAPDAAARPGRPFPPGETDNRVLWDVDAERVNALYRDPLNAHRAAIGLPPVDNVRDHVFTDRPWLAADPILCPWPGSPDIDVVQTGAWILPDERPLPADLEAFLDAGTPPVYVGFSSVRAPRGRRPGGDRGDPRARSSRARLSRLGRPGADRRPGRLLRRRRGEPPGVVRRGWPPSCITAARARRRQPPGRARPRWWCRRSRISRTGPVGWPTSASAPRTTDRFRPSESLSAALEIALAARDSSPGERLAATTSAPTGRRSPPSC